MLCIFHLVLETISIRKPYLIFFEIFIGFLKNNSFKNIRMIDFCIKTRKKYKT